MPQTTTKLPAELEQPGQPRIEIPTTAASDEPRPPRHAAPPLDDERGDGGHPDVLLDDRIPGMEPWLWVLTSSLAPATLALFVPLAARPALFVVTGALVLAGFVMLVVQERRRRER